MVTRAVCYGGVEDTAVLVGEVDMVELTLCADIFLVGGVYIAGGDYFVLETIGALEIVTVFAFEAVDFGVAEV